MVEWQRKESINTYDKKRAECRNRHSARFLQVVRILYRFFARILYQTSVASKGICDDFLLFFHIITSSLLFHQVRFLQLSFSGVDGKIRVHSGGALCLTLH